MNKTELRKVLIKRGWNSKRLMKTIKPVNGSKFHSLEFIKEQYEPYESVYFKNEDGQEYVLQDGNARRPTHKLNTVRLISHKELRGMYNNGWFRIQEDTTQGQSLQKIFERLKEYYPQVKIFKLSSHYHGLSRIIVLVRK